jgi:hypothetical protein|tara:strand:+ start:6954 stop:7175 length:222 start_codon:yes stop_codon:yes gene_type:complete
MSRLKVQGYNSLVRDTSTNAIINTSRSDYQIYMSRVQARESQGDKIRSAVKEINSLKKELREIKELIKGIVSK